MNLQERGGPGYEKEKKVSTYSQNRGAKEARGWIFAKKRTPPKPRGPLGGKTCISKRTERGGGNTPKGKKKGYHELLWLKRWKKGKNKLLRLKKGEKIIKFRRPLIVPSRLELQKAKGKA